MDVRTVPLLPCGDIDAMHAFWAALGATFPYRQTRPYPYLAVSLAGLDVHYYVLPAHAPEASHSSCLVVVPEPAAWFERLAVGLRARHGKLPLTGFPRITRPRRRKNAEGTTGFSLVDPGGNWLRFHAAGAADAQDAQPEASDPLQGAIDDAVVLADSKGDPALAARVLRGRVDRSDTPSPAALALLAELHLRAGEPDAARTALAELSALPDVPEAVRAQAADVAASLG
jgi:hypothetical protein